MQQTSTNTMTMAYGDFIARKLVTVAPSGLEIPDGWTLAQIGERYGVTLSAVGHAIQRWQAAGVMLWDVREAA